MTPLTLRGLGIAVGVVALLGAPSASATDVRPDLPPDRAVALALTAHPVVRQADATAETARATRRSSVLLLRNPQANGWATPDGARAELGLSQPLSLTGEGWAVRHAARSTAESASASADRTRRQLAADVRSAYAQAAVAVGVVAVAREGADLAGRLSRGVARKHEEGEASTLDLRLARLAEAQAATRLLLARQTEATTLTALAGWIGTEVTAEDLATDPLGAAPEVSEDREGTRSDLLAAEHALEAARATRNQSRSAVLPPISVGLRLAVEDGQTFAGPTVGLTLPLFDQNNRARAAAAGALAVAEATLGTLSATVATEQATTAGRLTEAEALADAGTLDDLDEARAALASIEAGVLAGEIDLPTAVLLQTQVLDGEAAVLTLRGLVADARIDRLLALDHDALLGGAR